MKFTKMHGAGNDYIYINCLDCKIDDPSSLALKLSDRHFGIGADGLVLIQTSKAADFYMRMFNADGSEGSMCGNAIRCVAKYVYDNKLTKKLKLNIETKSGIKHLVLFTGIDGLVEAVEVDMGTAYLKRKEIPMIFDNTNKDETFINKPILVAEKEYNATCVSMGNPHCIIFMNDKKNKTNLEQSLDFLDLDKIGPAFEKHPMFPDRINTEFVEVIDKNNLKMRVYERGSGETLACGTGACAIVVAAVLNGICKRNQKVSAILRGGILEVTYLDDGRVILKGEAVHVFDTEINI
ncbi:MAG: Diaminopimelate epimerase [Firmicutes bacterium ADurb.Bin146]|nr:MAG: Diaminopimelate epimerase [Firmicutes bacterium ADurb.Bin146]